LDKNHVEERPWCNVGGRATLEFDSRTAGNHEEFVMANLHAGILIPWRFQHVAGVLPSYVTAVFNMQILDVIR
jgi:hypothetical protein